MFPEGCVAQGALHQCIMMLPLVSFDRIARTERQPAVGTSSHTAAALVPVQRRDVFSQGIGA